MITITCEKCGKKFTVNNARKDTARFCSHKCTRNRIIKTCETCGNPFDVKVSHAPKRYFCCRTCKTIGMRHRRQAEIEKQFMEPIKPLLERLYYQENLGIKQIAKYIGVSDRNLWNWFDDLEIPRRDRSSAVALQWVDNDERKHNISITLGNSVRKYYADGGEPPSKSPEARKKISESKMGNKNWMYGRFGELNHMWKGGKVTYRGKGWKGIRTQVIRRDSNKCRRCDSVDNLQVHHITPYRDTQDNSFDNLVTLCISCHMEVEHHNVTWD